MSLSEFFACLRHERIRSWNDKSAGSDADGRWIHVIRARVTLNADPSLFGDNLIACAETGWELKPLNFVPPGMIKAPWLQTDFLSKKGKALISELGIKSVRIDATVLEEVLMSTSGGWLRGGDILAPWDPQRTKKLGTTTLAYARWKYSDRLLAIIGHLDETTPHFSAFVLPALFQKIAKRGVLKKNEKASDRPEVVGWKMCAWKMFSSKACKQNQTDYAKFLQSHGINVRRGIEGSQARHVPISDFYKKLNTPAPVLPTLSIPDEKEAASLQKPGQSYGDFIQDYVSQHRAKEKETILHLHAKAVAYDYEHRKKQEYQITASDKQIELQGIQERTKPISPVEALRILFGGIGKAKKEFELFHAPTGKTIAASLVDDTFWVGWSEAEVGKSQMRTGAIEAIRLASGLSEEWAEWWLTKQFGQTRAGATIAESISVHLPENDPLPCGIASTRHKSVAHRQDAWPKVQSQLLQYGLPESYLSKKLAQGVIGANEFGAVLFQKQGLDPGEMSYVVGTDVPGFTHQFDPFPKQPGFFQLGDPKAKTLVITDSPLLAMLLEHCHSVLEQGRAFFVSLLQSTRTSDVSRLMSNATNVCVVLRVRDDLIPNHEKIIDVPITAETINLGSTASKSDFFWNLIKEGCSGPEILNAVSRKVFGQDVIPVTNHTPDEGPKNNDPKI